MDHLVIVTTIVSVIGLIITVLLILIKVQIKAVSDKQDNLETRLLEEKTDRENSAAQKLADIREIFVQIRQLVSNQSRLEERIVSIKENCDRNCNWDGRDRRHVSQEEG